MREDGSCVAQHGSRLLKFLAPVRCASVVYSKPLRLRTHAAPIAVTILEFDPVVQQWQEEWIPSPASHPAAVKKLPVNQPAHLLNDIDLTLYRMNRDQLFEKRRITSRLRPLPELER